MEGGEQLKSIEQGSKAGSRAEKLGAGLKSWEQGSKAGSRAQKQAAGLKSWEQGSKAGSRAEKLGAGLLLVDMLPAEPPIGQFESIFARPSSPPTPKFPRTRTRARLSPSCYLPSPFPSASRPHAATPG
eukprot:363793-Chlamydomonas_euryale.AAC.3